MALLQNIKLLISSGKQSSKFACSGCEVDNAGSMHATHSDGTEESLDRVSGVRWSVLIIRAPLENRSRPSPIAEQNPFDASRY